MLPHLSISQPSWPGLWPHSTLSSERPSTGSRNLTQAGPGSSATSSPRPWWPSRPRNRGSTSWRRLPPSCESARVQIATGGNAYCTSGGRDAKLDEALDALLATGDEVLRLIGADHNAPTPYEVDVLEMEIRYANDSAKVEYVKAEATRVLGVIDRLTARSVPQPPLFSSELI